MIAANGVVARYLSARKFPSIRRVVRTPKRWDRIVEIARQYKFRLPDIPDSKALEEFLLQEKAADPLSFPDLSLAVIKLLGSGEYIVEVPEGNAETERFMRTMKEELLWLEEFAGLEEAHEKLSAWIDVYNKRYLHSALG
ncbi:MAG: transposase [Proteobacteria bacterium]|nr:transposase [Patescibacteria group bacterium]MBU4234178.1 transposase [Pseudomonadota bacterium]MBU4449554.1 transposase [Pseudomonadota bacterium]MCG2770699.1 transposase [Desulfobacterales bacterium]